MSQCDYCGDDLPCLKRACREMRMADGAAVEPHIPHECIRDNQSADFHTKSWSYRFRCPVCSASRRYNTNFLGNRFALFCTGTKIVRVRRDKAVFNRSAE